jgi:hypothetical protein
MNFNYEEILNKSYFTEKNFSGKLTPTTIINNFIPCSNLEHFHFLISFFLHLYTSLYIELKLKEIQYDYNISLFTELINNLKIKIVNDNTLPLSSLNNNLFIFNYNNIQNTDDFYLTSYTNYNKNLIIDNLKPVFGSYPSKLVFMTLSRSFMNKEIHKNNVNNFTYDNIQIREIIRQLLIQTPENIIGFVLYQKIYFNSILYNIDIQNSIRRNYLHNNNLNMSERELLKPLSHQIYINIINKIDDNINNLKNITDKTFSDKEFLVEKNKYKDRINVFNNLREEYASVQDKLNISIKIYNHELINYKKIKNYATYIIIILIILMVFTIFLSIFPIYKNDTKNAIYIIIFILLLIITYFYYVNFKYMILYEKFGTEDLNINQTLLNSGSCFTTLTYKSNNNNDKNNNIYFFNNLLSKINDFSNTTTDLFNNLRLNIYTIGNKSFSQDANVIINNVYLEKKRQLEINNIKLTNLFNMIEIIKKQKTYLFNFVFVIACLCLILLLGLVLYSSVPQLFTMIIIICVVLISILMIYFSFAIIQPTRMIADKNYWAITNPSKNTIGKL